MKSSRIRSVASTAAMGALLVMASSGLGSAAYVLVMDSDLVGWCPSDPNITASDACLVVEAIVLALAGTVAALLGLMLIVYLTPAGHKSDPQDGER